MKYLLLCCFLINGLSAGNFYYEFDKKVEMQSKIETKSLNETNKTYDDIQEYTTTDNKKVKFKNEILVKCTNNSYCLDDFEDLNLTNYKEIGTNTYLIKLDEKQDIFLYCKNLYEKNDIESAHPNYIRKLIKR